MKDILKDIGAFLLFPIYVVGYILGFLYHIVAWGFTQAGKDTK